MTSTTPAPLWAGRTLALLGIVIAAANLRTAVAALSPIVGEVSDDIPIDSVGLGLLGTLPPLCFAVFGLLAPALQRRVRLEVLLVVPLIAILLGHLIRAVAPSYPLLAIGSALAFAGMGVANVALPPIVKKYFPDRIGLMTSVYATMMSLMTLVPPLVAVPVADAAGWRVSLGFWGVFAIAAVIPWIGLLLRERAGRAAEAPTDDTAAIATVPSAAAGRTSRSPLAWGMAVMFGTTSLNVYALFAWLPQLLVEDAGVSTAEAGTLLALYAAMGFPASIVIPILAVKLRSVGPLIAAGLGFYLAGYAGLILSPATGTWLWVALAGAGPLLFPLTLVLINLRTRTAGGAVALSGFTQGVGYIVGAVGPLVFGLLHEATDGWTVPLVFLVVTVCTIALTGAVVSRPRYLEDDWSRRP
ncbi:MFS transporter [Labedella endophytica]|uniref:MFS transporter n=1 Tax=Labedella endophytica TaxID=1523160 RepID=A0A433JT57_9MICO|nr:MFS transporter [Labedella endophytica]RUR01588.1 MFS transporter [Labedella endophytica]